MKTLLKNGNVLNVFTDTIEKLDVLIEATGMSPSVKTMIAGWVECVAADDYTAHLRLLKRE